ncbi:MAG: 23S rRNA (adenine(2503)-C(2))-methyltransferase RlmN [Deltaproteobacteria bacterium]|nr:23S rRNA (adenine(2503)-C(2))-methyltransferase RlmN [Deltaproteobacteria bacterium]
MNPGGKIDLKGMDTHETVGFLEGLGLERYRAKQIRQWLFKRCAVSFDEMTNLSKPIREKLKIHANISPLQKVKSQLSKDGTEKSLFRLWDGLHIESVLIPERDHFTLCVSSQAGCAMGCRFCLTARQGFRRDLTPAEIVEQVIQSKLFMNNPDRLTNIVFMGMGEPLANYYSVLKAIGNLVGDDGMNFSHRKITLSTSGLVPRIRTLGEDTTVNLAVSLNAADDETRDFLMPINRKYPLASLLAACRDFPLPNRRMITFEYVLIDRVNDRAEDAYKLVRLLSGIRAKINLISMNPAPGIDLTGSSKESILRFQDILIRKNFTAIIRKSKGQDISAACGQLSGETDKGDQ